MTTTAKRCSNWVLLTKLKSIYYWLFTIDNAQFSWTNFHSFIRYIQQYVKIFTEEGRRPVTIKHNLIEKLGQEPKITTNNQLNDSTNNSLNFSNSSDTNPLSYNKNFSNETSGTNGVNYSSTSSVTSNPAAFSNSTLKKPFNSSPVFSGISFHNFFDPKSQFVNLLFF